MLFVICYTSLLPYDTPSRVNHDPLSAKIIIFAQPRVSLNLDVSKNLFSKQKYLQITIVNLDAYSNLNNVNISTDVRHKHSLNRYV